MLTKTIAIVKKLANACAYLLYPPLCAHCQAVTSAPFLLCSTCANQLTLIDPNERCPRCFSADYCPERALCIDCQREPVLFTKMAAAFNYTGPAASLVQQLKYGGAAYLAEGCGAYLTAQFLRLEWPHPDLIVPVPIAFNHWLNRGYNQSQLLAKELGKAINCPVTDVLVRKSGDYSQAGLSHHQRRQLTGHHLHIKSGSHEQLREKRILLIDDVSTTTSTMRRCAEALAQAYPASIYGLVFCRATW